MEHILSPLGHGFVFGAGRILFAGRTRTGRWHSKMGFYVIVPRKARHDSTGNPISSFNPAIAPLDCERWMANKRTDVLVFGVLDKTAGNNI